MSDLPKIDIIGTGLVGSGQAIVFARAGCPVAMFDVEAGAAARARESIAERLGDLNDNALLQCEGSTARLWPTPLGRKTGTIRAPFSPSAG